jgi:hypothetical protein
MRSREKWGGLRAPFQIGNLAPTFFAEKAQIKAGVLVLALVIVGLASPLLAQQKGQWVPGQFGLNAGVIPDPGITYANLALNYSSSQLNDSNGNQILKNVTGTYSFWADENIIYGL